MSSFKAHQRESLPHIVEELKQLNEPLAIMFEAFVLCDYEKTMERGRKPYLELLEHVRKCLPTLS